MSDPHERARQTGVFPNNILAMIALAAGAVLVVLAIIQGVQQQ